MMSRARLVMRSRLPLSEWKYEMIVRPFLPVLLLLEVDNPVGDVESFRKPHL